MTGSRPSYDTKPLQHRYMRSHKLCCLLSQRPPHQTTTNTPRNTSNTPPNTSNTPRNTSHTHPNTTHTTGNRTTSTKHTPTNKATNSTTPNSTALGSTVQEVRTPSRSSNKPSTRPLRQKWGEFVRLWPLRQLNFSSAARVVPAASPSASLGRCGAQRQATCSSCWRARAPPSLSRCRIFQTKDCTSSSSNLTLPLLRSALHLSSTIPTPSPPLYTLIILNPRTLLTPTQNTARSYGTRGKEMAKAVEEETRRIWHVCWMVRFLGSSYWNAWMVMGVVWR
mmetsp:Transcript_76138/g.123694  ORF Transcript_76138/g.123694 Transcript_76138/m.123694 type:complete len:280 (+) Transcript_76138:18-857(+)